MSAPIVKSRRQHLRLWFEFYKLCHRIFELKGNLKESAEFYAPWGDVRNVKFDAWWKDHQHLFGETLVQEVSAVTPHPDVMHLAVPLNQTVSMSLEQIEGLIKAKQTNRLKDRGINPLDLKSKSIGFGQFKFTEGVEVRGATLNDILITYATWLEFDRPAVNSKFCQKLREVFEERPISTYIPYLISIKAQKDENGNLRFDEGQVRQIRRYLKRGIEVCLSVSLGKFPGKSRLD
jgi:hypothetical protein